MNPLKVFYCLLWFCCLLSGCFVLHPQDQDQASLPFRLEIVADTRERVLVQTLPWEEQMMGYFKVLRVSPGNWQMWYSSWDNKRKDDYSGFLVYAYSSDGKNWIKQIPGKDNNILRGSGHPQTDGVVEQDVFIEPGATFKYKMIYTAKDKQDKNREKTYVEESKDGINWVHKRVLWNRKHDSQFCVIPREERYYIYLRSWEVKDKVRYRTIGLAIADKNWNTIQEPVNLLKGDFDGPFPHLYNPGASKVSKDLDLLFPTFFNEKTNAVKFGLAYVYRNKAVLTDIDLSQELLAGEQANWGIVSPGLIPAGKNTYWMYYYATNMVHSDYEKSGRRFNYYRIKVKIKDI